VTESWHHQRIINSRNGDELLPAALQVAAQSRSMALTVAACMMMDPWWPWGTVFQDVGCMVADD